MTQTGQTPFGALERASRRGEFYYHAVEFSFGPFVDRIGRYPASGSSGWVYKVNHVSPPVGANVYQLENGDEVLWYFARFGAQGGPKTLDLVRRRGGCFRAFAYDDNGDRARATDVVFVQDGRRIRSALGQATARAGDGTAFERPRRARSGPRRRIPGELVASGARRRALALLALLLALAGCGGGEDGGGACR